MKRSHRYRVSHVTRADYGPDARPSEPIAHLRVVDDGSNWAVRNPSLTLMIAEAELEPGDIVNFTLEKEAH
jgi:hypothetical protein